jgi:hypothetical protein
MQQKTDDRLQQQAFRIDDAVNALIDSYVGLALALAVVATCYNSEARH